jgi:CheY-like chemotaxis protein
VFQSSDEILIAEDNGILLSVLSEIVTERGYSVRIASDGLAALSLIRRKAPGILLSDLMVPRMSGLELLSIVRRHYPVIKVVAMSGSYHGEAIPPGVAADAFYPKGATSVVRLLQIVTSLRDENELRSRRVSTPIWIPRQALTTASESGAVVACPECLRPNPHPVGQSDLVHHAKCPYCLYPIELAVVPFHMELENVPTVSFSF